MFSGRRLSVVLVFGALVAVTIGVSCSGFFPSATLSSIAIQPPGPQVQVGSTTPLQAWGTDSDNNKSQLTSGVVWSTSDPKVITVDGGSQGTHGVIGGVTGGTATITASAQGVSGTATATAFFGSVSNFQVCMGTAVGSTTSCSSGSTALSWAPNVTSTSVNQNFIAQGVVNNNGQNTTVDLTTTSTWTISNQPASGTISCATTSGSSPEVCTVPQAATASPPVYVITVTYGSGSSAQTATINVTVTG